MVRITYFPFSPPALTNAEKSVVRLKQLVWLSWGLGIRKFEDEFRAMVNAKFSLALNPCPACLHMAMAVLRTGDGGEEINVPTTFSATANVAQVKAQSGLPTLIPRLF
jgi:dTDP-4-amino-4,6-dideoxygalactose transaminase